MYECKKTFDPDSIKLYEKINHLQASEADIFNSRQ